MGLDELFELLDCYVEQSSLSTFPTWEPNKLWYSTDKITCSEKASDITSITTNKNANAKLTYYDGGDGLQLKANH